MSHYLPTISILVDKHQLPKNIQKDENVQFQFLGDFYKKTTFYQCTTRNWQHTENIKRVAEHLQLKMLDFLQEECKIIPLEILPTLQIELQIFIDFIIDNERVKEYLLEDWNNNLEINRKAIIANFSEKEFEKTKRYFEEQRVIINALSFSEIYQQANVVEHISEFDLQDKFSPNYYDFITVVYWLKTFTFVVEQGIKLKKSIIHIMLYA